MKVTFVASWVEETAMKKAALDPRSTDRMVCLVPRDPKGITEYESVPISVYSRISRVAFTFTLPTGQDKSGPCRS